MARTFPETFRFASIGAMRSASLVLATLSTGLIAGVFGLYAHAIMPGLRATDDRTFVRAFQSIDRSIINPLFIGPMFLGAALFTAIAAVTNRRTPVFAWTVGALVAYLVAMAITGVVHVPLNDTIKAAGNPDSLAQATAARAAFHEARWAAWNVVRAILSTGAFAMLLWSMLLHGRATP